MVFFDGTTCCRSARGESILERLAFKVAAAHSTPATVHLPFLADFSTAQCSSRTVPRNLAIAIQIAPLDFTFERQSRRRHDDADRSRAGPCRDNRYAGSGPRSSGGCSAAARVRAPVAPVFNLSRPATLAPRWYTRASQSPSRRRSPVPSAALGGYDEKSRRNRPRPRAHLALRPRLRAPQRVRPRELVFRTARGVARAPHSPRRGDDMVDRRRLRRTTRDSSVYGAPIDDESKRSMPTARVAAEEPDASGRVSGHCLRAGVHRGLGSSRAASSTEP